MKNTFFALLLLAGLAIAPQSAHAAEAVETAEASVVPMAWCDRFPTFPWCRHRG
ncbi:MAG: hypothetical protein R2722_14270 [Tessaracoccus sp.]